MLRRLLAHAALACLATAIPAVDPPPPPADFAQPQSPKKPDPFEVKYVDQGQFDPKLKGLLAPEGFKVELVADAPTVVNPVGMTFATDGTLFVLEWKPDPGREWFEFKETVRYRDGTSRQVATMKKFVGDPVKTLSRNAKGVYDKAEVLFTDELPSTILLHDGWLYLTGRGTVRRYKQQTPGGKWDLKETIAQGFCGFHHHQVSGLTVGPDGWLYVTSGDDDNYAEGSDGSRATVLRTGAVFRCKPDGSKMETFSLGYRNPYRDVAFDANFNMFHSDNDNEDGSRFTGCRLMHVAEESDYGWRLLEGARCCRPDNGRGAVAGERPGKLPPMAKTGRGSPAGVLIYNDTQLPEQYRGLMYYPDVFRKVVRAYKVAAKDSTFEITNEFEFLKSDDPLFRPCQMITGPDGAIYVCDWRADSGGAGKLWGDGVHGRIYRMSWAGTKDQPAIPLRGMDTWAKAAGPGATLDDLSTAARSPDATTRQHALLEFAARGRAKPDDVRAKLTDLLTNQKEKVPTRLLALGGLQQMWADDTSAQFLPLLSDPSADVRRMAAEALGRNAKAADFAVVEALRKKLSDESKPVRRVSALALGRLAPEGAADAVIAAWKADEGTDPFLTDAYLRALERLGKPGMAALVALAASGQEADLKRAAGGFLALRSKAAADAIPDLLGNPHLTPAQKADLVYSYTNYQLDPPLSLDPLAKFLATHPDEPAAVKTAGLEVLAATGGLGGGQGTEFVLGLIDAKEDEVRLAAYSAIEKNRLVAAAPKLRTAFADPTRSVAERAAALKAGRTLGGAEFAPAVKSLLDGEKEPAALKVEALRTLTAVDPTSVRAYAEKFLDQPDPALIAESVSALGTTKEGAKLVGERYLAKKLPRDLFPRVSEVLRKYPADAAVAKMAADVLRGGLLLSLEPDQVEAIRAKVLKDGDPKRGKAVYLNTAVVACATCHRLEGVGGQVGPDLTRVWDTHTVEKILESIVAPSKEIKEGYQAFNVATLAGQNYTGLKVVDTPAEVVIREASGKDVKIARKEIDGIGPSKLSLMPDNVVSQLSFEQFIDLVAFLKSKSEQESLRGTALDWSLVVGVPPDLKAAHAFAKTPDVTAKPDGIDAKWVPLSADAGGLLALKPHLPAATTGVYAVTYVFSPKPQTVTATLLADDPVRVTVGGEKAVFERATAKTQKFEQGETFKVDLPQGWTPVVVKAVTSGPTHRLGLQFTGTDLRTAAKPEK